MTSKLETRKTMQHYCIMYGHKGKTLPDKRILRFVVEVDGQSILYHFSKSFDLVRMFWIAQGISVIPPGEDSTDIEE